MKTARIPYVDINHTLKGLKLQVIDSLEYAEKNFPLFRSPKTLFEYLKDRTTFQSDPKGVELLQSLQTLMRNGGKGDCDCFVIALLAVCWSQGEAFQDLFVMLAGRETEAPVHIYVKIIFEGEAYIMDLTEPSFNQERPYKYTQQLKFKI